MTKLRPGVTQLIVAYLVCASSVVAADADKLERGRQFLYCGVVTMKVIEWTGQRSADKEAVEKRSKAAYTRMLIQTAALIPKDQLNHERRAAQERLDGELKAKAAERATNPAAVGAFLGEQYASCQKLESEKGKEAFTRGVEAMTGQTLTTPDK